MLREFHSPETYLRQREADGPDPELAAQVTGIIDRVRDEGDAALTALTKKFDGVRLHELQVSPETVQSARQGVTREVLKGFKAAIANVRSYHEKQRPQSWTEEEEDGSRFGMQFTAIEKVGVYIPGSSAGYPSTVIMTVVPAQIAGVKNLALVSPPNSKGLVDRNVLAVADLLGVRDIYSIGGAQAIAALAYGTKSIPAVDKIVGPGNAYVNEAKRQVFGEVGIDQLAGPTEVVILADKYAKPEFVAWDMVAQAEHDAQARAVLVTTSKELARLVQDEIRKCLTRNPREDILRASLAKFGAVVFVASLPEGADLVSEMAPEHVQLLTEAPDKLLPEIRNAGAICLGEFTPAVVGDYMAGPNHVLPTGRNARFSSPLNVADFMKFSSIIGYSRARFNRDAARIASFASLEGLVNHERAITSRL